MLKYQTFYDMELDAIRHGRVPISFIDVCARVIDNVHDIQDPLDSSKNTYSEHNVETSSHTDVNVTDEARTHGKHHSCVHVEKKSRKNRKR